MQGKAMLLAASYAEKRSQIRFAELSAFVALQTASL
jgi:hypothetical protein